MNAHLRSSLLFALIGLALITQIGASCTNTDTTGDRDNRDDLGNTNSIPRDARKVAEGAGQLAFAARSDGRVYLYDIDDRVVIDNRALRRDERYSVDPDQNRILIDDRRVSDQDLKRKHNHRIYFLPNDRRDRDDWRGSTDRLPRDARNVATGTGQVSYRARDRGRVYVYDADDQRVLFVRDIRDGQEIVVDPENDRVLIDGKKVYDNNLERKHTHRIYFEKD